MTTRPEDTMSVTQLERALERCAILQLEIHERRQRAYCRAGQPGYLYWETMNRLDAEWDVARIAQRRLEDLLGESVT